MGDNGTISEFLVDNDSGDQLNRGTVSCFDHKLKDVGCVSRIKVQHKSDDDMIVNGVSVVRSINGIQQSRNDFTVTNNTWIGKDTKSEGVWVNTITPRPRTGPADVSEFTLTGKWEVVQSCDGAKCKEITQKITTGVETGKEVSKSSTIGESLSLMVGTEVKAGTGSLPGAEVTTKFELTGTMSQEQSTAVANSFSTTRNKSVSVTCLGQGTMWQWVSSINIIRVDGARDVVEAYSTLTKCAKLGETPSRPNDISWGKKAS